MAEDSGTSAEEGGQVRVFEGQVTQESADGPVGDQGGSEPTFKHIHQHDYQGGFPAQDPEGVGAAGIAAAIVADIDAPEELAHDDAGGYAAHQVAEDQECQEEDHSSPAGWKAMRRAPGPAWAPRAVPRSVV
jgi:hypothetical protein